MIIATVGYTFKADVNTTFGRIQHVCSRGDNLCADLSDAREVLLVGKNRQIQTCDDTGARIAMWNVRAEQNNQRQGAAYTMRR